MRTGADGAGRKRTAARIAFWLAVAAGVVAFACDTWWFIADRDYEYCMSYYLSAPALILVPIGLGTVTGLVVWIVANLRERKRRTTGLIVRGLVAIGLTAIAVGSFAMTAWWFGIEREMEALGLAQVEKPPLWSGASPTFWAVLSVVLLLCTVAGWWGFVRQISAHREDEGTAEPGEANDVA